MRLPLRFSRRRHRVLANLNLAVPSVPVQERPGTATPEPLPGRSRPALPVPAGPAPTGGVASDVPAGAAPVLPGTAGLASLAREAGPNVP